MKHGKSPFDEWNESADRIVETIMRIQEIRTRQAAASTTVDGYGRSLAEALMCATLADSYIFPATASADYWTPNPIEDWSGLKENDAVSGAIAAVSEPAPLRGMCGRMM